MKTSKITKEGLLDLTEGGWLYFLKHFPELKNAKRNEYKCDNIINHRRGEKKASLSCYQRDGKWFLHDHADSEFSGDLFTIYAYLNNIDDVNGQFYNILSGLYKELTGEDIAKPKSKKSQFEDAELPEDKVFLVEEISFENLGAAEISFLDKFQIKKEVMRYLNSVFIQSYTFTAKSTGKTLKINKRDDEVIIGHWFNESIKIYKPYSEDYKIMWLGGKPKSSFYGKNELRKIHDKLKPFTLRKEKAGSPKVILCAGEKDVMVMSSLGYTALCLNSETSTYFPEMLYLQLLDINDFSNGNLDLIILYDNDKAGIKHAKILKEKHEKYGYKIRIVSLPDTILEKGGKDVADWISMGFPKQDLISLIEIDNQPCSSSPISPESPIEVIACDENENNVELNNGTKKVDIVERDIINEAIPEEVTKNFPDILKKALQPFNNEHKTMMTLAFLTVIGSILHNVIAKFRSDKIYSNLYTIIIAPPASGKSLIKWARFIIKPIESYLNEESKRKLEEYDKNLELVNNGELSREELGPKPAYRVKLIPTDITSSMWVQQISDNDGYGLMYDTEIDGLVESNSGSLRAFTDYLRKAYEGEPLSLMRKTDRERILVEEGKMSMLISGTPQQFFKLIPDGENGLFSRVIPFKFNGSDEWLNTFELDDDFSYEDYYKNLSYDLLNFFKELDGLAEPICFQLSKGQLNELDKEFTKRLKLVKNVAGVDAKATVFRLGAITGKFG